MFTYNGKMLVIQCQSVKKTRQITNYKKIIKMNNSANKYARTIINKQINRLIWYRSKWYCELRVEFFLAKIRQLLFCYDFSHVTSQEVGQFIRWSMVCTCSKQQFVSSTGIMPRFPWFSSPHPLNLLVYEEFLSFGSFLILQVSFQYFCEL